MGGGVRALIFVASLCAGCAAEHGSRSPVESPPLIALLPFANGSNVVEAPQKVRTVLFEEMQAREFRLMPLDQIDPALRQVDVTLGSQLNLFDDKLAVLHDLVPADVYGYGTVVEFGFKNAVALTQRKVELKLKLVDAKTGTVLFEGTEFGVTSRAGLDALADATINVAGKVAKSVKDSAKKLLPSESAQQAADLTDVIADVDLTSETREAIRKLLHHLPAHLSHPIP